MRLKRHGPATDLISAAGKKRLAETDDLAREALRGTNLRRATVMQPLCKRMQGMRDVFSREKDSITAGVGDKGRQSGYVRTVDRPGWPWETGP